MLLPSGGRVLVNGMDTSDQNEPYEIRRMVGMVLQNPDNQIVSTIVEEDVAFGPENLGIEPSEIRRRVDEALKRWGCWNTASTPRTNCPAGEAEGRNRRRFSHAARMYRAGRATSMLDPKGRKEVLDTISRLNRERGITIVLITHFMEEAVLADRVVVLENGRILLQGPARGVFRY